MTGILKIKKYKVLNGEMKTSRLSQRGRTKVIFNKPTTYTRNTPLVVTHWFIKVGWRKSHVLSWHGTQIRRPRLGVLTPSSSLYTVKVRFHKFTCNILKRSRKRENTTYITYLYEHYRRGGRSQGHTGVPRVVVTYRRYLYCTLVF